MSLHSYVGQKAKSNAWSNERRYERTKNPTRRYAKQWRLPDERGGVDEGSIGVKYKVTKGDPTSCGKYALEHGAVVF